MPLCTQSDIFAFQYAVKVYHSFPSRKQASFNFMTAVIVTSDFGTQEKKICHLASTVFPFYLP